MEGCGCDVPAEIQRLRQEIAATGPDKAFDLTSGQAKALSGLSWKAPSMKAGMGKAGKKKAEPSFMKH